MKKFFLLITCSMLIMLIGCDANSNTNQDPGNASAPNGPGIEGYVVGKENGRILVIDPIPQDFSSSGGISEFYNAIWFSNVDDNIEIGEKVQVWFDIVAESYPGQAEATKTAVMETEKPGNSDLTEAQAIQRALQSDEISSQNITVILTTDYDATNDKWKVEVKQGEKSLTIQVVDSEKEVADKQKDSSNIPEVPVEKLETEFQNRLYKEIEVDEQTRKVKMFNSKSQWIEHMTKVMDEKLAQELANDFYNEKDGELYLISRGGPVILTIGQPYETNKIDDTKVEVFQKGENMLHGKYELAITYSYRDSGWIIQNRQVDFLDDVGE
ncbi:YobA family protein [Calidifontibacillus oryziterrae]|uniref:YobA family protein n=1 Tax=Calidifontibacillus oryziterrae TaxID=1191699 RepID=UPI000317512C|nr:YobA family protein [Calidifontibacillus oryziterrae]